VTDTVALCLFGGIAIAGALVLGYALGKRREARGWRLVLRANDTHTNEGLKALRAVYEADLGRVSAALERARADARGLRERFADQLDATAIPERRN
jgi:hypothetical protein